MRLTTNVSLDDIFEQINAPVILGPSPGSESDAWLLYLPDETPCICDTFKDAAAGMQEYLKMERRK